MLEEFAGLYYRAGAMPAKRHELVAVAVMTAARCAECVPAREAAARAAGASGEELGAVRALVEGARSDALARPVPALDPATVALARLGVRAVTGAPLDDAVLAALAVASAEEVAEAAYLAARAGARVVSSRLLRVPALEEITHALILRRAGERARRPPA